MKTRSALILLALAAAARAEIRWQSPQEAYQSGYFNDAFDEYGGKLFREAQAAPRLAELLAIFAQEAAAHRAAWQGWDAAEALYRDGKYAEALVAFQRLAEAGNRLAALRVAEQYRQGKGVAESNEQYRVWFEKAVPGLPYGDYPRMTSPRVVKMPRPATRPRRCTSMARAYVRITSRPPACCSRWQRQAMRGQ